MNKITLAGRLVKDPEEKRTVDNKEISKFTLAVNRAYRKEITDYIPCSAFGTSASFCNKYLKKGSPVAILGSLYQTKYTSQKTGKTVYGFEVVVEEVQSFSDKKAQVEETPTEYPMLNESESITDELSDDDLPF